MRVHRPVHHVRGSGNACPEGKKISKPLDDACVGAVRRGHVTHGRTSLSSQVGLFSIHADRKWFDGVATRNGPGFGCSGGPVLASFPRPPSGGTSPCPALVAKRRESHPGCAEESWLRRGRPDGAKKAIPGPRARFHRKASWPGNGSPRVASLVHLLPAVRQRNVQALPRRPHQR